MSRLLIFPVILWVSLLCSCQPDPDIIIVPDNTAPPDPGISQVVKENYVNKLYISLLGRKPTETEFQAGLDVLALNNVSVENREALLEIIFSQEDYFRRMYEVARIEMLNNLDTADITFQITLFNALFSDPNYEPFYFLIQQEIDKLQDLKDAPDLLVSQQIDRKELHRRMAFNYFYDQINMGSQNFVLAMFEYFLGRYPSVAEEEAGITMVDGLNTIIFGKEGDTKEDFVEIFLSSDNYYEGAVIDIYEDFLFRKPTSVEMSTGTLVYRTNNDYAELLKSVLTTDEYLGL